ncbi:hypothetical protein T4B_5174 [Trichinella pseudospiralis]|uniref:Uncharacterized protein n=1 Tax=Trichinella pseudospiralis TaxID=6337 RepID=A0A0V1KAC0_TRIPS|nr:hypothetical protein T4A_12890 [Trichinella pseudospiralis]KRZ34940.1 hypothetical protein T4B_5174 [Trichinella pseudospiralis]KRZ44171.1 hypothetical protein T4C_13068 [Trichinella pseudospiralis]
MPMKPDAVNLLLHQAYQQLLVDDKTADAQTIITHHGVFRAKRLQSQFSVIAAPMLLYAVIAAKDENVLTERLLTTILQRFNDSDI